MGSERVTEATEALGLEIELVERPAADSLEGAAALLGLDPRALQGVRIDGTKVLPGLR